MSKAVILALACWLALSAPRVFAQSTKKNSSPPKKGATANKNASPERVGDRRLSIDQIRKLIAVLPDSGLAQEITDRGISEDYNRQVIDQLRQQGGGQQTLAALDRALPFGSLKVKTEPGAVVRVDGGPPLPAAGDGTVSVQSLEPGSHTVLAEKQNFTPVSRSVDLKGRESATVEAKLEWSVGFLTVSTDVPDGRIRVGEYPDQIGRISKMAVPVGQVTVMVTAPLRTAVTRTVGIESGKDTTLSISMVLDQLAVAALAKQIHLLFQAGKYSGVLQLTPRYLQTGTRDKGVLADLAVSYLELGNFDEFSKTGREALATGGTLHISMLHHHGPGLKRAFFVHAANVEVTATAILYRPTEDCNIKPFDASWSDVKIGTFVTFVAVKKEGKNYSAVDLKAPNPSDPKKNVNLHLALRNDDIARANAVRSFFSALAK